jgi:hypothetical protein
MEEWQVTTPTFWRSISAPSTRPCAGGNNTCAGGASQFFGTHPNDYQILWASQYFGMVTVGCYPNVPIYTPRIDIIARTNLTHGYVHSSWADLRVITETRIHGSWHTKNCHGNTVKTHFTQASGQSRINRWRCGCVNRPGFTITM